MSRLDNMFANIARNLGVKDPDEERMLNIAKSMGLIDTAVPTDPFRDTNSQGEGLMGWDADFEGNNNYDAWQDKGLADRNQIDFQTTVPFDGVPNAKPVQGELNPNFDALNAASDTATMLDQNYSLRGTDYERMMELKKQRDLETRQMLNQGIDAASDTATMLDQNYDLNPPVDPIKIKPDATKLPPVVSSDALPIAKTATISDMYNRITDTVEQTAVITADAKQTLAVIEKLDPVEKPGFFKSLFQDRERMLYLALAFNTMRLDPDDALAGTIKSELKDLRKNKGSAINNKWLKKHRPDIYQLVMGGMDIKDAVKVMKLGKFSGNITLPPATKDHIIKWDDKTGIFTQEIIPGSPTDLEQKAAKIQTKVKNIKIGAKTQRMTTQIDEAIVILENEEWASGIKGAFVRDHSGFLGASSPAINLKAKIDATKANIGFDALQKMRDESPTGGALGQVAVMELIMLQATYGNLDLMQDPKEVIKTLKDIKQIYNRHMQILFDTADTPQGFSRATLEKYGIFIDDFAPGSSGSSKPDPLGIR
jgi:hypothetical protein